MGERAEAQQPQADVRGSAWVVGWQASTQREPFFGAGIYNSKISRFDVECREPPVREPEINVTYTTRSGMGATLNSSGDFVASIAVGGKSITLPMTRIEGTNGDVEFRYTAVSLQAYERLLKLADFIAGGTSLSVSAVGQSSADVFSYTSESASSVDGAIHRCGPAAVAARQEAAENSNVSALATLETSADEKCRGGDPDSRRTADACDERVEYDERLAALGMCYGLPGQFHYQETWHKCGQNDKQ